LGKVHFLEIRPFHNLLLHFIISNLSEELIQLLKDSGDVQISHWTHVRLELFHVVSGKVLYLASGDSWILILKYDTEFVGAIVAIYKVKAIVINSEVANVIILIVPINF
jgi:hypothetical protein